MTRIEEYISSYSRYESEIRERVLRALNCYNEILENAKLMYLDAKKLKGYSEIEDIHITDVDSPNYVYFVDYDSNEYSVPVKWLGDDYENEIEKAIAARMVAVKRKREDQIKRWDDRMKELEEHARVLREKIETAKKES